METPTLQRPSTATAAGTMMWRIDPNHSTIGFAVKHMKFTTVHGRFDRFAGTIRFDPDRPADAEVAVVIDTTSIDTGVGPRDADLRSARFFDVEQYPVATFHSTSVVGNGERFSIEGELTIRDVTRAIALTAEFEGRDINPSGIEIAGFEAAGRLNRKDYGLGWNQALESGGVLVGDEITLSLEIQARRIDS